MRQCIILANLTHSKLSYQTLEHGVALRKGMRCAPKEVDEVTYCDNSIVEIAELITEGSVILRE